ncbi:anti-phage dCTP deaminase [Ideonella sp. DXS29W]|uniref:Anti-phage dCTP deaminase n=1 Tax=Ideonella lacteola TaxID=2984193 RepID=A0ABU9BZJ3_9BURK
MSPTWGLSTGRKMQRVFAIQPVQDTRDRQDDLLAKLRSRESKELVVAFAGPIGSGVPAVINQATTCLESLGYTVVPVKLSDFLQESLDQGRFPAWSPPPGASTKFARYRRLQEAGKTIREKTQNQAILAEQAIWMIRRDREARTPTSPTDPHAPAVPQMVAYLIDQIKRPEEVQLLRALYRNLFYLVGVTRSYRERRMFLENEGVKSDEVDDLIDIDRNEDSADGQRVDRALFLSDLFVRNDAKFSDHSRKNLERFLRLIHGDKSQTPTVAEQGMYAAFAASLQSACLSRQVGAAIISPSGQILATGRNDVPASGGGLYGPSHAGGDHRCLNWKDNRCRNDFHKRQLQNELISTIVSVINERVLNSDGEPIQIEKDVQEHLAKEIYRTRLGSLIEFSRSVHAEMDAITSVARSGGQGLAGASLYTTTFPCHSCARHIVAAGITHVYFIEPYEKSMAKDLHEDSISFEFGADADASDPKGIAKVKFLHFEGVSPRRFAQIFYAESRKDSEGRFKNGIDSDSRKVIPEYLDKYQDFEEKAVEHLNRDLEKIPAQKS